MILWLSLGLKNNIGSYIEDMNKRMSTMRILATFLICVSVGAPGGFFVYINSAIALSSDVDKLCEEKDLYDNDELDKKCKEKDSITNILEIKAAQESVLNSQIYSLDSQTEQLESNIRENWGSIDKLREEVRKTEWRIEEQTKLIDERKEILAEMLRSYYDRSAFSETHLLLGSESAATLFVATDYAGQIQENIGESVREIIILKESLDKDKQNFEDEQVKLKELNTKLEQQTTYLESAKKQKEEVLDETQYEKRKYENKLSSVQEKIRDVEREIQEIESVKSQGLDLNSIPKAKRGLIEYPVKNPKVTQSYGKTSYSHNYGSGVHNGVDFGDGAGTKIYAVYDGKITGTGNNHPYDYGKWVTVEHTIDGKKIVTLYGHLSSIDVDKGDKVDEGDKIGKMGNTGNSTGPHLHFTVFQEKGFEFYTSKVHGKKIPVGAHVNPYWYLP